MFCHSRVALAAVAVAAPLVAFAGPAQACYGGCDDSTITVHVSDDTPASGQQFIARGRLIMGGLPAADHVVRFQTYRNGSWEPIKGAHMLTDSDGKYRMRLILSQTGHRVLRAVGVGEGDEPTQRERFSVTVH
jgi:hypothetical protein